MLVVVAVNNTEEPLQTDVFGFAVIVTDGVEPEFELTTIVIILDVTVVAV